MSKLFLIQQISIPDVHPDGFKNIIKYAYTGMMNVYLRDVITTMYASQKYDIPELSQHCSQLLHSNLSVKNVVTIYQTSVLLNEIKLNEKAWKFIECNAAALLDSEQFTQLSEENLLKFLKLDEMPGLKTEADVFKALLKWGNFQCDHKGLHRTIENLRTVLKNAISLIRYTTMEADEFNEIVASEMLSLQECVQLLTYFTSSAAKRFSIANTLKYPIKNRTGRTIIFCTAAIQGNLAEGRSCQTSGYLNQSFLRNKQIAQTEHYSENDLSTEISTHANMMRIPKILEICYIEFDLPVSLKPNVQYQIVVNCYNGNLDTSPIRLVKYSKDLLSVSKIIWTTSNQGLIHDLALEGARTDKSTFEKNYMQPMSFTGSLIDLSQPTYPTPISDDDFLYVPAKLNSRSFGTRNVQPIPSSRPFTEGSFLRGEMSTWVHPSNQPATSSNNQQAVLHFAPRDCAIWAMQFEN